MLDAEKKDKAGSKDEEMKETNDKKKVGDAYKLQKKVEQDEAHDKQLYREHG
jgi:hypothetical protein